MLRRSSVTRGGMHTKKTNEKKSVSVDPERSMRKSKRSVRHQILLKLLNHLKSYYDFELTPDAVRDLLYSNAGIDALFSFRSDSRLNDLRAALARLESGTFGICISCKQPIALALLYNDITRRICPSCEAEFNHRWQETIVPASSPHSR